MKELLEQALLPYNLPLTCLMGLVMLYWLSCIFGIVGMDSFDVDLDADLDVDADLDADGAEGSNIPSPIAALLRFVNATDVPLMAVLSFLAIFMWVSCMMLNYYFNPWHSDLLAVGFFCASFVFSVFMVKLVTMPLVPVFKKMNELEKAEPIIGSIGTVISSDVDNKFGQVEVTRNAGAPAKLNCYTNDELPIPRSTQVAILEYDSSRGIYRVSKIEGSIEI